jgi:capsular polysaccharide biosynthesis protein
LDLIQLFRALGRRWYAVVFGVVMTALAAVLMLRVVPVTYDAHASMLLLPPTKTVTESNGNPFLVLGGLDTVAGVLSLSLTDSATVSKIAPPSSKTTYTVAPDQGIPGSVVDISTSARSATEALALLHTVEDLSTQRLAELQNQVNAPEGSQARIMVITDNNKANPNISALSRALIVVVAVGLVLTFLLTISLDAIIRRRATRKARRKAKAQAQEPQAASDDAAAESSDEDAAGPRRTTKKRRTAPAEATGVPDDLPDPTSDDDDYPELSAPSLVGDRDRTR